MPLVSAKCPQCGAPLKVDSKNEAAICEYCKMPFIVEKAINNYNIEKANITINSIDVDNLIKLANEELVLGHDQKVFEYATKILEIDSSNSDGWLLKLQSCQGDISDLIGYGNNAIKYDTTGKVANEVCRVYLELDDINTTVYAFEQISREIILDKYSIEIIKNKARNHLDCVYNEIVCSYSADYFGNLISDDIRMSYCNEELELITKFINKLPENERELIVEDAEKKIKFIIDDHIRQNEELIAIQKRIEKGVYPDACIY